MVRPLLYLANHLLFQTHSHVNFSGCTRQIGQTRTLVSFGFSLDLIVRYSRESRDTSTWCGSRDVQCRFLQSLIQNIQIIVMCAAATTCKCFMTRLCVDFQLVWFHPSFHSLWTDCQKGSTALLECFFNSFIFFLFIYILNFGFLARKLLFFHICLENQMGHSILHFTIIFASLA